MEKIKALEEDNMQHVDRTQEVLNSPFDIDTHKATFIDYLELILLPDGTPVYAVPSHQMKLMSIYGKSPDEIYAEYLQEQTGLDAVEYLCRKTNCVSVWCGFMQGVPNPAQLATLHQLKDAGLYQGGLTEYESKN